MRFSSIKNSADTGAANGGVKPSDRPHRRDARTSASTSGEPAKTRRQRGGGRPPRKPEEGPKVQVGFQVTSVERDQIREAAGHAGLSVSEFLRRRALGRPVVPLADAAARKALRRIGVDLNQLVRRANSGSATEADAKAAISEVRAALARVGRGPGEDGFEEST